MTHLFGLAFLMLATTSCTWVDVRVDKYEKDPEKQLFSEKRFLDSEKPRYKDPSGKPQYCLAFSGGGVRSAAYSIGVLKGLHESKKLRDVDIISAVSGGSYAATWLYAQYAMEVQQAGSADAALDNVLSERSINEVAAKVGPLVLQLNVKGIGVMASGSDSGVFAIAVNGIAGLVTYIGGAIWSNIPPMMGEGHETGTGRFYKEALEKTFHIRSDSTKRLFIQATSSDLPYLIVNATVQGVPSDGNSRRLANEIFEFTSHGMGSPSVGYKSWAELTPQDRVERYDFPTIASISGAAVDKTNTKVGGFKFLNVFGRDMGLGYAMLDPTHNDEWVKRYLLLTDGGHSENLGAYSLIKRDCNEIILVDAEYDGNRTLGTKLLQNKWVGEYQFDGYRQLKNNLLKDNTKILEIDRLDRAISHIKEKEAQAPSEQGTPPLPAPDPKPWSCWYEPFKTNRELFDCSDPISLSQVYLRKGKDTTLQPSGQKELRVTYVKLSANRRLLDGCDEASKADAKKVYGPRITAFYNNVNETKKKCENNEESKNAKTETYFPHYDTFKLTWSQEEFLAIAELGCRAVRRHYDEQFKQSEETCISDKK